MTNKFIHKSSLCCVYLLASIHWINPATAMDEEWQYSNIRTKQNNRESNTFSMNYNIHNFEMKNTVNNSKKEENTASSPQKATQKPSQKNIQQGWDTMCKSVECGRMGDELARTMYNMSAQAARENRPFSPDSAGMKIVNTGIVVGVATSAASTVGMTAGAAQYLFGKAQEAWEGYSSEPSKK